MKKIYFLMMIFVLLISSLAFGGLINDAEFSIEHGCITATVKAGDVLTTRSYNLAEFQISVLEKIGSNYKIAIHKLGTKWREETHILYIISEEKLNYIGKHARKIVYSFSPQNLKFVE